MKLKITQKGFENYSGQMGAILFKDGVSVYDVNENAAYRLSALFGVEWDTGESVKITRNAAVMSAPIGRETFLVATDGKPEEVRGNDGRTTYVDSDLTDAPIKVTRRYSIAELEAIADEHGIKGLRDIAGPLGIKGTSINALIDEIMQIAGKEEKLPEGVEIVGE